ncbi:MAG: class I SAM-dependent methyltransferase [Gemmataceae bacterium]
MNHFLHGVARAAFEAFALPGPVLEVGSYQVAGQERLIDLRRYFPDETYVGLDMRQGPGVDRVGSVEELPFPDRSFGTVIAMSTFEHVRRFWRGFAEVRRVLRPGGVFLVSCPFHFHIHAYPSDYWRFTPEAFKLLLEDYPAKLVGWHGPADRPANVWALAFGDAHPPPTDGQVRRYRAALARHAREPMSPLRKLRYRLGRLLCGSRPFAPWLLREAWQLEVLVKEDPRAAHPEPRLLFAATRTVRKATRPTVSVCIVNWNCRTC